MVVKISDHVAKCFSSLDGKAIYDVIKPMLEKGDKVELSFARIDAVTSSFVNAALIELLEVFSFDYIKGNLSFTHSNKGINKIIKSRFDFEVRERPKHVTFANSGMAPASPV